MGSDSIVTLTQKDSIVAYASLGSMLQKLMRDIEMSTQSKNVSKIAEKNVFIKRAERYFCQESVRNGTFPALELVITQQQISIISNRKHLFQEDTFMACNFGGWIVSKLVVPS